MRARQLIRALTLLAYGVALAAFARPDPLRRQRADGIRGAARWSLTHGVNLV